jgi:hypothetical protein
MKTGKDHWTGIAKEALLGKVITDVRYMTTKESKDMYLWSQPIAFCLDNKTWVFPLSDDEGNDGGTLAVGENLIPVMREVSDDSQ